MATISSLMLTATTWSVASAPIPLRREGAPAEAAYNEWYPGPRSSVSMVLLGCGTTEIEYGRARLTIGQTRENGHIRTLVKGVSLEYGLRSAGPMMIRGEKSSKETYLYVASWLQSINSEIGLGDDVVP